MRSRAEYAIVPYVPPPSAPYSAPHAAPPPVGMADLPDDVVLKMLQYLIDFEPAATFAGARFGFVFKTGRRGLGYYVDAPERAVGTDYIRLSATCSGLRTVVLSSLVEPALSSVRDMQDRAAAASHQHRDILRQKVHEVRPAGGGRINRYTVEIAGASARASRARVIYNRVVKFADLCREARRKVLAIAQA